MKYREVEKEEEEYYQKQAELIRTKNEREANLKSPHGP